MDGPRRSKRAALKPLHGYKGQGQGGAGESPRGEASHHPPKWTPRQWAAWEKRQFEKECPRGSPQWLLREVAKFLAEDGGLPVDDVMNWIIEHNGIDFLVKGAESIGRDRLQKKSAIVAASRALVFYIDPDNAAMFGNRGTGN